MISTADGGSPGSMIQHDPPLRRHTTYAFSPKDGSTNAAISMCTGMNAMEKGTLENIVRLRDFFLDEHKKYYASTIANIGANYKAEDSIAKLEETKTRLELETVWRLLSEDERRDVKVIKVALALKAKYPNEKV
mgnify:CR=1 FL=1